MPADRHDARTVRLHRLCEQRIAFFMHELQERNRKLSFSAELECFFEDEHGRAIHLGEERAGECGRRIAEALPSLRTVGLDYGTYPTKRPYVPYQDMRERVRRSVGNVKCDPVLHSMVLASTATGYAHAIIPYFSRQYEFEFWPEPLHEPDRYLKKVFDFLADLHAMPACLREQGEEFGYSNIGTSARRYRHTLGYYAAPSLHFNVGMVDADNERDVLAVAHGKPHHIARRIMDAMCMLDREGCALFLDNPAAMLRVQKGWQAPRRIAASDDKRMEVAVCFRTKKNDAGYTHIEHRAPPADSDPYLIAVLTLGAFYLGVCHPNFSALLQHDRYRYNDAFPVTQASALERLETSRVMRDALGDELYRAACERGRERLEAVGCSHAERVTARGTEKRGLG